MGFVLYGSGAQPGGRAGHALAIALGWTLGRARVLVPFALTLGGGVLLARGVLPALRPLRAGACCLFASLTLALSAGTLGLSSGHAHAHEPWSSAFMQSHGGVLGEALYQLTHRLGQDVGVQILVVFLALAAVILLTGASLAGVVRATGSGVADTTRMLRSLGDGRPRSRAGAGPGRAREDDEPLEAPFFVQPPEPGAAELVVRATHVEAPSQDWREGERPGAEQETAGSAKPAEEPAGGTRGPARPLRGPRSTPRPPQTRRTRGYPRALPEPTPASSRHRAGCAASSARIRTSPGSCRAPPRS